MFGKKRIKEGDYIFASKSDGEYNNIIIGVITGVDGSKIGVNGLMINPVGLKNKIAQGKAGPRSEQILKELTPDNCIFALIYRVEHENFTDVLDVNSIYIIPKTSYSIIDGWIRESIPEHINNVLSLPEGDQRDQAKRILKQRMETLFDKNLRRNLYAVCRGLKILT